MKKRIHFCLLSQLPVILCTFIYSFFLSGCASLPVTITEFETGNKNITVDNILKIQKGKSTTKEIKEIFGEPDSIIGDTKNGTTTWVYLHTQTKQKSSEHAPFQIDQTQLEITFNEKGIVIEYTETVSNRLRKNR